MKKPTLLYRCILSLAKLFFAICYRHRVYGREHTCQQGAIIASNHTSFLDPPILAISWPEEVHFLARESLFSFRPFGAFIAALNSHPVKGGGKDLSVFKMVTALLLQDKKVILFPEGTRSRTGELTSFKPGVAFLLMRSKKAIIPAYIDGAYEIWSRTRKLPKLWGKTVCVFGSPILYESFASLDKKEAEAAVSTVLKERILQLKEWLEKGAVGTPP